MARNRPNPQDAGPPSAARRSVLTGTAAGFAAVAATTFGRAQPASAQTQPSVTDWINAVTAYGADPTGASDSTTPINSALTAAGNQPNGGVVYMPTGVYQTSGPLVVPPQVFLLGAAPASAGMNITSPDFCGTIIEPSSAAGTWAKFPNNPGVIYVNASSSGSGANVHRPCIANLWINGTSAPSGIHGISAYGGAFHGMVSNVGVYNVPRDGMHFEPDAQNNRADGWTLRDCVVQTFGRYGIYWHGQDTQFINVHVQAAQASTSDQGCWWIDNGGNCMWIGCRADQGAYGFVFDTNPGGSQATDTPGSTQRLIGCGTENTYHAGLWLNNTSTGGTQMRTPVSAVGCSFDYAGRDLSSPAIQVTGYNILTASDTNVTCSGPSNGPNGGLYPFTGLATAAGSGGGIPALIDIDGGFWNVMGNTMINDAAGSALLRYRFYGYAGTNIVGGGSPTALKLFKTPTWP